jgi:hypothetical protein
MTNIGDPEEIRTAHEARIREQAEGIATLATAIAAGTVTGPRFAAVARLVDQVDTLRAWTPDDRSTPHAVEVIGQHVPQPDGSGGKFLRP